MRSPTGAGGGVNRLHARGSPAHLPTDALHLERDRRGASAVMAEHQSQ